MVKIIKREATIHGVNVTGLCEWLKDPEMYAQYHREYNHNNRITISDWVVTENVAERDVYFLTPLRGPGFLKRATGTDVIRVHDQHRVTAVLEEGAIQADINVLPPLRSVIFESKPAIAPKGQADMPMAKVRFVFSNVAMPDGQPACKLDVHISCTAESFPWLWALHSVIEKVMGAQCKYTADGLIEFWQRECARKDAAEQIKLAMEDAAGKFDAEGEGAEQEGCKKEVVPAAMVADDVYSIGSSVYYDAEDDLEMLGSVQHISKKEKGRWINLFCCFGACAKQKEEVPTETHLLD